MQDFFSNVLVFLSIILGIISLGEKQFYIEHRQNWASEQKNSKELVKKATRNCWKLFSVMNLLYFRTFMLHLAQRQILLLLYSICYCCYCGSVVVLAVIWMKLDKKNAVNNCCFFHVLKILWNRDFTLHVWYTFRTSHMNVWIKLVCTSKA